jgi:hypothetical protein
MTDNDRDQRELTTESNPPSDGDRWNDAGAPDLARETRWPRIDRLVHTGELKP